MRVSGSSKNKTIVPEDHVFYAVGHPDVWGEYHRLRNAWAVASVQDCVAYGTPLVLLAGATLRTGFPVSAILVLWNYGP